MGLRFASLLSFGDKLEVPSGKENLLTQKGRSFESCGEAGHILSIKAPDRNEKPEALEE